MKDCHSLQYEKDQCRKILHYISGHTFRLPSIGQESSVLMTY